MRINVITSHLWCARSATYLKKLVSHHLHSIVFQMLYLFNLHQRVPCYKRGMLVISYYMVYALHSTSDNSTIRIELICWTSASILS